MLLAAQQAHRIEGPKRAAPERPTRQMNAGAVDHHRDIVAGRRAAIEISALELGTSHNPALKAAHVEGLAEPFAEARHLGGRLADSLIVRLTDDLQPI